MHAAHSHANVEKIGTQVGTVRRMTRSIKRRHSLGSFIRFLILTISDELTTFKVVGNQLKTSQSNLSGLQIFASASI